MKYKVLKISFVMFLLFINTVFAQTVIDENSKEYTSRSYQEDVNKVLDVKLEQYETVYVYKFVNTQNGNSNYLVLDSNGNRIKDNQKITNAIFSVLTHDFMVSKGDELGNIFDIFKSDIETVRDDQPLIKAITTIFSKVAKDLSISVDYKFISISLSNIELKNYDQLYNLIDSIRVASRNDLRTNPINFRTNVLRFYANEITLEKSIPDLLTNPSTAVTKLTTDLSNLQKFSIPSKNKEFLQISESVYGKIEQRIKYKQAEATSIFMQAQQTNDAFKSKIKEMCLESFYNRCSKKAILKNKYSEFNSKIYQISPGDEKFNTYISNINNTLIEIKKEEEQITQDIDEFNLFSWLEKIFF